MAKVTFNTLVSLANQTAAMSLINSNFSAVAVAMENTLSRDGTTPNTMGANFDMNSYRILNLPEPLADTEPLRLIDAQPILDAAEDARDAALAALDSFTDIYLGVKPGAPSTDNDGNALLLGALYYNSNDGKLYINGIAGWESTDSDAAVQAAAAAASAAAAAQAALDAADSLDDFQDIYLGASTSEPTLDLNGGALTAGDLYFNTLVDHLYVYDGLNWVTAAGINAVVEDVSTSLGGDLDLNSNDIIGTGNITITGDVTVTDDAYAAGWNGSSKVPTRNAVYDKIESIIDGQTFTGAVSVPDDAYAVGWNGSTEVPTKNAVYDKIESIIDGQTFTGDIEVPDEAYGVGWDGSAEVPTKNAVYDKIETLQPLDADLTALAALNTTGVVARTAANTYAPRTITGTASNIAVTNGDGVSGDPTIDLVNTAVTPGSYTTADITVDAKGRITAAANGAASGISMGKAIAAAIVFG